MAFIEFIYITAITPDKPVITGTAVQQVVAVLAVQAVVAAVAVEGVGVVPAGE